MRPPAAAAWRLWQCLTVFFTRLAGKHLHVNQAGNMARCSQCQQNRNFNIRADGGNLAVTYQQATFVSLSGSIRRALIKARSGSDISRCPALHHIRQIGGDASNAAMRTATPISLDHDEAYFGIIRQFTVTFAPRFIGPGCITSALGFAKPNFRDSARKGDNILLLTGLVRPACARSVSAASLQYRNLKPSRMVWNIFAPSRSASAGINVRGPTRLTCAPMALANRLTRHTRMANVAANRDFRPLNFPKRRLIVSASAGLGSGARCAVACVQNGAGDFLRQQCYRSAIAMAYNQQIGVHGVQRDSCIKQRLALFRADDDTLIF